MESELIQALSAIKDGIDAAAQPRFIDWFAITMSFVSVVVTGMAIWYAVQVPKKIAKQQNKIALFEKRYGGTGGKTLSLSEINAQINELLKASIQSEWVISQCEMWTDNTAA